MTSEIAIQKAIIQFLASKHIKVWRNHANPTQTSTGKYRANNITQGMPDIIGHMPNGLALYIEVKTPDKLRYILKHYHGLASATFLPMNKQKMHLHRQISFIEEARIAGCVAGFAATIEDTQEILAGRFYQMVGK